MIEIENYYNQFDNIKKYKEEMKEQTNDRILAFCKEYEAKYGLLAYKRIEHNYDGLYDNLDIITKKKIIKELNNTIIISQISIIPTVTIMNKDNNIHEMLLRNDNKHKSMGTRTTLTLREWAGLNTGSNRILNERATWFKLYTKDGKELDFIKDVKNLDILKLYMENPVIIHSLLNGLPIPYVDFHNEKMVRVTSERLKLALDSKQLMRLTTF